ncbi:MULTISPECIES: hypothetical protein [Rhizobium]|uniref:Uncharacterized protein n=1 Tax=Rhizobium tropici TaxID=398 RepID=A0A329Y5A1_RHITR|nr:MULTISPECIES: hypothetical protein [Rhizobium]MBB3285662.1 hypothetical protein [Rhizobium sp. BK252]MBB3400402.1 hypothetical protein [Rhizobium sp. BK289]MBB3412981.1 hypothetical protein [Rhizobium sp. BK284]MBB3480868.1 hypothetical protein [Rhizobium sp. BK347]MDK4721542.1 hypothetical protein [Rhizobium sp. CNPSo 3968]
MTILFAFGMPGVMSSWGVAAVHALAREAFGDYAIIATDTIEDLKRHVQSRSGMHAVLVSQFPEARLSELILRVNVPFLLFLEDPIDAVSYLARATEQRDIGLVRAVSASLACLEPLANASAALVLRRNDVSQKGSIDRLLREIDDHFSTDLTLEQIAKALRHVGMAPSGQLSLAEAPELEEAAAAVIAGYLTPQEEVPELSESLRETARKVLHPLQFDAARGEGSTIFWPQETFFSGDRLEQGLDELVDLTGGARCLIYGPYLHLPIGHWNAKLNFDVDEDCYGQIFTIEIHATELLGKLRVCPQGTGSFEAAVPVDVVDPRAPIEIRLMMDSGAIEGRLSAWSVEWQRAA